MAAVLLGEARSAASCERLVEGNLGFVVRVANEYRGMGVPFEDLLAEGNLGLFEAARRYDSGSGAKFITYAVWWIRKRILQALDEQSSLVRLPCHHRKRMREIRLAEDALRRELGRDPHREEISRRLGRDGVSSAVEARGLPAAAVGIERVLSRHRRVVSLDRDAEGQDGPMRGWSGRLAGSNRRADEDLIHGETIDRLVDAVDRLPPAERSVIRSRFGLDAEAARTLREIGREMGLSRERVRQIECRAKERLRRLLDRRAPGLRSDMMPPRCPTTSRESPRPSTTST